jgi:hypothetical protein
VRRGEIGETADGVLITQRLSTQIALLPGRAATSLRSLARVRQAYRSAAPAAAGGVESVVRRGGQPAGTRDQRQDVVVDEGTARRTGQEVERCRAPRSDRGHDQARRESVASGLERQMSCSGKCQAVLARGAGYGSHADHTTVYSGQATGPRPGISSQLTAHMILYAA